MSVSRFFSEVLGAPLRNQRWSWGAVHPQTGQIFLRVWEHDIEHDGDGERVSIMWEGASKRSSGYQERLEQIELLRGGAGGFGVVCKADGADAGPPRTTRSMDQRVLLRFGKVFEEGSRVFARIVDRVPVDELEVVTGPGATLFGDLEQLRERAIEETTKQSLTEARLGQGAFRAAVMERWGHRCAVTGVSTLQAIRASHVKPWADANDAERLDPANGLPLIATLDALFDAGLISFDDEGKMLVAGSVPDAERRSLGLESVVMRALPAADTAGYLVYHRSCVFLGK